MRIAYSRRQHGADVVNHAARKLTADSPSAPIWPPEWVAATHVLVLRLLPP